MRTITIAIAVTLTLSAATATAEPIKFARYPHASHGKLVFSYHGDIWVANENGSNPMRLTAHVAQDTFPRISPDGRWVAFSSDRFGNTDVFVIPITGGEPRQLTFNTTGDTVLNWMPDGQGILVATSRAVSPWRSPLHVVPLDGGLPTPLPMDGGVQGMVKQDGSMVAFNRSGGSYWRKGYQGNRADDIWVQNLATKQITRLTDTNLRDYKTFRQDVYPMWGNDGNIYFSSERSGIFNIWRIAPAGGEPERVTNHGSDGVQFPSISADGSTIAYENEFDIWTLKVGSRTPARVAIDLAFDPKLNLVTWASTENRMDGFAITPEGDYAAIDFHGEIFLVPTDPEVGEKRQVTSNSWRDRRAAFSPNGRYVAYTSDQSKEEEVWVFDRDTGDRRQLTRHASFKSIDAWSPDSTRIAWTGDNRLFVTSAETGATTELGYNVAGGYTPTGFSPDGRWLVLTRRDADMNSEVMLFDIEARREVNVTDSLFAESQGTITPDGTTLVFVSDRAGSNHLWKVALSRQTEDPNDPVVRERRRRAEAGRGGGRGAGAGEAGAATGGGGGTAATSQTTPPPPLTVDTTDIRRRAVQITTGEQGVQGYFLSTDGQTIYFRSSDDEGPGLFSIGIDGKNRQKLVAGPFQGMTPTADRRTLFYAQSGELWKMEMSGQRRRTRVPFEVTVRVDRREEWAQILDEAWRVMKYRFYDPNMHGKDWNAIKAKYEPLLKYVGENQDVYDLANEMIGELNASHTGVSGPDTDPQPSPYQTRYLGFEMTPEAGGYKVTHIYRDGPADKEWIDLEGRRVRHGHRRHAHQGGRQLLAAAQQPAERIRPGDRSGLAHRHRDARPAHPVGGLAPEHQVRGVGREEPRICGQGNQRRDCLRAHPVDEPALARPLPDRGRSLLEQEGDHRRHPVQRRRQHRPAAHRHPRAPALRVLEQPVRRADVGPPAAAGDCRPEGDDDQRAVGIRLRSDAAGLPRPAPRPHRRQSDGGGRHRDRIVRTHQRRIDPDAGVPCRDLRPGTAEQPRRQPGELRRGARRVGREHARGRAFGQGRRARRRDCRGHEDARRGALAVPGTVRQYSIPGPHPADAGPGSSMAGVRSGYFLFQNAGSVAFVSAET